MTLKDFESTSEHIIVRNAVLFKFHRITDCHWILEVSVATLPEMTEHGVIHEWTNIAGSMTGIEAYYAYHNILDGGLK